MHSKFAFWTEILPAGLEDNPNMVQRDARLFIIDIPEGTSPEEVIRQGGSHVRLCYRVGETLKSGFCNEWHPDIRDEFRNPDGEVEKLSWPSLLGP